MTKVGAISNRPPKSKCEDLLLFCTYCIVHKSYSKRKKCCIWYKFTKKLPKIEQFFLPPDNFVIACTYFKMVFYYT